MFISTYLFLQEYKMNFEIFKVGKHTSSNGITKEYSLDHLNQIVANHSDPTPIVVGHPKDNSPAFGWIKNLFVKGNSLFAEASDIIPEFLDLLKQKIYKNRSVSLKTNDDGELFLNHVAFLGGTLPAVKGLEELNLSSDDFESFELALSDAEMSDFSEIQLDQKSTSQNLKPETSNPNPVSQNLQPETRNSENFAEEISDLKSIVSDLSSQFTDALQTVKGSIDTSDIQGKIDELNLKLDSAYFQRNIIEKLQMENLTPAIKNKILNLLSYFESLEFSEDENKKVLSDFQELADLIEPFQTDEVLKKIEFNTTERRSLSGVEMKESEFSEMNVDKDSLKIYNEANALAEKEEISFSEAVNKIISNN